MNAAGLEIIDFYESFSPDPYLCPAGIPTIGKGTTVYPDGRRVTLEDRPISELEANRFRDHHIAQMQGQMLLMIHVQLTDNQYAALGCLVYNIGLGNFATSTLLRVLNTGDYSGAADQFMVWNKGKVNGKKTVMDGLVKRRAKERRLFLTPDGQEVY